MSRAAPFRPLAALLPLAIAACAVVPPVPAPPLPPLPDAPFAIDGRLAARRGGDAIAVGFAWSHDGPRDELVVQTPLGQAVAELASDASVPRAEVRMADGRYEVARDFAALTERAIGFAVPIDGLVWWARASPHAGSAHSVEVDASGRAVVLRQDGCVIAYAYADAAARRPARLDLSCHDLELRIVIDRWRAS